MAEAYEPFDPRERSFLRELLREDVRFMVVGLGAAALQGAPLVTQDIDLWFRTLGAPGLKRALRKVGGSYIPPVGLNPPLLMGDAVALFDIVTHMHGLGSFDDEWEDVLWVPVGRLKIPVLKLDRIIASKEATGRDKDKLTLPVLKDAWETVRRMPPT